MMNTPGSPGYEAPEVSKFDIGAVGAVGDGNYVEMIVSRRPVSWPVSVGSPPPMASAFQHRSDIDAKSSGRSQLVLGGSGGTGKSQIAVSTFKSSTADLRIWVSGESRLSIVNGYAAAALRLDLADVDSEPDALALRFIDFLRETGRSWLVIVDDLTDPADMVRLWPPTTGRLVVTTRRRDAVLTGGGRVFVEVGVYSPDEANAYLRDRFTPLADELPANALEQADELARDLGFLPLALSQAAAVVINEAVTCLQYRLWFADRSRTFEDLFPDDADADGYAKTVAGTWILAVDTANKLEPVGLSGPLAHLVACFDPAGTPEEVFTSMTARQFLKMETGRKTVSAVSAREALRTLHRLSLITHDPRQDPPTVRMHNLTGRAIRQPYAEENLTRLIRIAGAALDQAWPTIVSDRALSETLRANTTALRELSSDALWDKRIGHGAARILFRSGRSLSEAGLVAPAIVYYLDLVVRCQNLLGFDHPDTLTARSGLADAYKAGGDIKKAISLQEQALADCERILGPDHPRTLTSRNDLAHSCQATGDLKKAISLQEHTLADRERVLGPNHPHTMISRNNVAYAYQAAGDLNRAIPLHKQTLEDRERILGADHPETLTSRNNLAATYQAAGDLSMAIALLGQTLADRERILGPDHPDTLRSRSNLASTFVWAGDLKRAIPLCDQTLRDRERILGPDHPDTLHSRSHLADCYRAEGNFKKAISLHQQTLEDRERILGADHPDTLSSRHRLANSHKSSGAFENAIFLHSQTLADRERVLGPDHPDTLSSRFNLADTYQLAGDFKKSLPLYQQTLADRERVLGLDHPQTLLSRKKLDTTLRGARRDSTP